MPIAAGSRIGPYEIHSLLGAGGMGQVWRAHDTRLERDIALKVLPADALGDDTARARLVREARLASKLNHPHICAIYEVGEAEGQTYIAMELVEGQSLAARVAEGPLPVEQILRNGQQMADALAHAHGRGVVHRDFKSANVVVTPDGQVKVLDFGLAKRLTDEQLADATTVSRQSLSAPGVVAGTLAYMAPEQLQGHAADARSDIWALGVVLYELATGKRPFQGQTGFDLTAAILREPLPALPSSVPAPLAGVVDRCLAKEPGERYQQGSEVRAALGAVASGEMGAAWSTWRVMLQRRRRLLLSAAAGALALLIIAAVLFGLDVRGVRSRVTGAAGATARVVRLAVLPFANVSGDAAQEYLSDGLTQEMIAQLGRLHPGTLSVIARTSVMQYKKTNAPINQIGHELGVDYVLEGSAQRETGQVRITAALIKVADQTQLWAESYEREISGILALQSEVAQKVASALALKLLPAERARLANVRTINPDAYEAYLKGLQRMYRLTPDDLTAALKYFEVALAKEPDYALAYAGISLTWSCRNQMYVSPPSEAVPKAKAAALKAIELDDSLAEAHLALAGLWSWADWNLPAADAEWRRAIQLNPSYPDAHAFYSHYLMHMGRPTEAMAEIDRGLALDPFNPIFQSFYAIDLVYARRYDDALGVARKAPGNPVAVTAVWWAYSLKKMPKEAYAAVKAYLQMAYGDKGVEDALDQGYAHGGYPEAAKRAAAALIARGRTSFVGPIDVANLYVDAGEKKLALDWLEKSFEARDPNVPYIGIPFYHSLRQEPRYQALLRRIGLPQ
jgi:TolB-like protein/tRNA A-37 threonylcarbamoyl transferase component Bud32